MGVRRISGVALGLGVLIALPEPAFADGLPKSPPSDISRFNWTGVYIGTHTGGAVSETHVSDPYGKSIYGDDVTSPGSIAGGQIGLNYQFGRALVGLEAAGSWADLEGTNTCFAFSGTFVSANCKDRVRGVGTLTGRLGYALGASGRTLVYGKGGAAWVKNDLDIANGNEFFGALPQGPATRDSYTKLGWTVGGGVEQALTSHWSIGLEYDFLSFRDHSVATPPSFLVTPAGVVTAVGSTSANVSQDIHLFKLGMNYRFGGANSDSSGSDEYVRSVPRFRPAGLEVELGGRYWYSTGKFQWDNFARVPRALESRLTYDNLRGNSGEFFGRVDTPFDVYVKGNVGGGNIIGGQMNDEDWGIVTQGGAIAYTNTISHEKDGDLRYGTIDIGYDLWRTRAVKVGPFVGYNLYREKANSFGCVQIANPAFPCLAPGDSTLIGNQENEWKSVRVGTSAEIKIAPNVKLTGDAAYLPHVSFDGRDNHLLRNPPVFFDQDGDGRGVQLEAILSVDVTPRFSLGVGGRYWSMWTTDAAFTCTGCTAPGVTSSPPNPSRNSTERFGLLLQGSYKFAEDEPAPLK